MRAISKKQNREFVVKEADKVEILSLVDSSLDFQSHINKQQVQSFRKWKQEREGKSSKLHIDLPFAEHGFSLFIRVFNGDKSSCILFDTGGSPMAIIKNAQRMGLDLSEIEGIVLSHGHYDHFGGLVAAVKAIGKSDLPVIIHKNMFRTRGSINAMGRVRRYPDFPSEKQINSAHLVSTKQPSLMANGMACVTGEIPRRTSFEVGYVQHRTFVNGKWKSDPLIMDERAVAISIKRKGLVVLSGCAHAGIINTVNYAQKITGIKKVYAVMGGFHLAGKTFENRIQPTIEELQRINPHLIVPSHCTGWKAKCAIAKTLPEAFVWNSVGNLYSF